MSGGYIEVKAHDRCPPGKCIHRKKKQRYKKGRKSRGSVSFAPPQP